MLRRRELVQDVFDGFVLRGVVQRNDLKMVVDGIDERLMLGGVLKGHKGIHRALEIEDDEPGACPGTPQSPTRRQQRRDKEDFFKGGGWTFEQFWHRFASVIMRDDVVPFSAIKRGIEEQQKQALVLSEAEAAQKKEAEEKTQAEVDERRRKDEYRTLYDDMQENLHIQAIINENKVLTGDDVRPGDLGFEFEVPPHGDHVALLFRLLILLGFESVDKSKEKSRTQTPSPSSPPQTAPQLSQSPSKTETPVAAEVGERWWDDVLASAWTTLQEIHQSDLVDGVVERECLQKVLVPPAAYAALRRQIVEEVENREDQEGAAMREDMKNMEHRGNSKTAAMSKKPRFDTLCQRLGVTMTRMEWLHRLFESYLQPTEDDPHPMCLYPESPGAISKAHMRSLMKELRPAMEEVEFEARFRRIDQDLSGTVEFDEFVTWVREDEVRPMGAAPLQKMTFEELAVIYDESLELIMYLYDQFQDCLPEGVKGGYPSNPRSLGKTVVRGLVSSLTPDMSDAEFETHFQMTTFSKKDTLEFDEFLEVLAFEQLPEEIRACAEPESPSFK
jgi:Ca2+-binding EF-hand superfamily protein